MKSSKLGHITYNLLAAALVSSARASHTGGGHLMHAAEPHAEACDQKVIEYDSERWECLLVRVREVKGGNNVPPEVAAKCFHGSEETPGGWQTQKSEDVRFAAAITESTTARSN